MGFVIMLNITDPGHPLNVRVFDFDSDEVLNNVYIQASNSNVAFKQYCAANNNITSVHVLVHPQHERHFILLNYFLQFGLAQFASTRAVRVFKFLIYFL